MSNEFPFILYIDIAGIIYAALIFQQRTGSIPGEHEGAVM